MAVIKQYALVTLLKLASKFSPASLAKCQSILSEYKSNINTELQVNTYIPTSYDIGRDQWHRHEHASLIASSPRSSLPCMSRFLLPCRLLSRGLLQVPRHILISAAAAAALLLTIRIQMCLQVLQETIKKTTWKR